MEVKVEEALKSELPVYSDICQLCVSTERRTYGVESVSYAYGVMTDWAPQRGARVCWECRAALVRLLRLKVQALRARELLDAAARSLNTANALSGRCMSQLSISTTTSLSFGAGCSPSGSDTECKEEVEAWSSAEPFMMFNVDEVEALNSYEEEPPEHPPQHPPQHPPEHPPPPKEERKEPNVKGEKTPKKRTVKVEKQKKATKGNADVKNRTKVAKVKRDRKAEVRTDKKEMIEVFTVTPAELEAYRANVLDTIRPSKYSCTTCVETFLTKYNLNQHNSRRHSEACSSFVCDICNCGFASSEKLDQHRSEHFRLFRCLHPDCGFVHHRKNTVHFHRRRHFNRMTSDGSGAAVNYECDYCGATFPLRIQMYRHIKMHQGRFLCETCGKGFSGRTSLQTHYLTHVGIDARPFPCTRCSRKFITKDKLAVHMMFHEGIKPFGCDECDRKFRVKADLNRHKMLRHSTVQPVQKRKLTRTKSKFRNEQFLVEREKQRERDGGSHGDVQKITYQCDVCGKKFAQKVHLTAHAAFHTGERLHKCDECHRTFKYRAGLWAHKLVHKGLKAHQCTICGAQFTVKGNLNGHMKIHTKDKPYECDVCGQRFPWRRNLRNHFKVHSK